MAHFFLKKVTKFVPAVGFGFDSILVIAQKTTKLNLIIPNPVRTCH